MHIHLDQVREEPFTWQEELRFSPAELERPELVSLSPVECRGRVRFIDPDFLFEADLAYEQTLACTRCLQAASEPVEARIDLLLTVSPAASGRSGRGARAPRPADAADELELGEEDLGVLTLPGEEIDTAPLVREQVQLNIPMKPLCRPECQGLCPICGADLNAGACRCETTSPDPRWAALAALRGQRGGEG